MGVTRRVQECGRTFLLIRTFPPGSGPTLNGSTPVSMWREGPGRLKVFRDVSQGTPDGISSQDRIWLTRTSRSLKNLDSKRDSHCKRGSKLSTSLTIRISEGRELTSVSLQLSASFQRSMDTCASCSSP